MSSFPPELIARIVDEINDQPSHTLRTCSLASTTFREACQRRLFETQSIITGDSTRRGLPPKTHALAHAATFFEHHPHLARHIATLDVKFIYEDDATMETALQMRVLTNRISKVKTVKLWGYQYPEWGTWADVIQPIFELTARSAPLRKLEIQGFTMVPLATFRGFFRVSQAVTLLEVNADDQAENKQGSETFAAAAASSAIPQKVVFSTYADTSLALRMFHAPLRHPSSVTTLDLTLSASYKTDQNRLWDDREGQPASIPSALKALASTLETLYLFIPHFEATAAAHSPSQITLPHTPRLHTLGLKSHHPTLKILSSPSSRPPAEKFDAGAALLLTTLLTNTLATSAVPALRRLVLRDSTDLLSGGEHLHVPRSVRELDGVVAAYYAVGAKLFEACWVQEYASDKWLASLALAFPQASACGFRVLELEESGEAKDEFYDDYPYY
ncbi:hypothetical protein HMN09_01402700 [Mycena chlorophos]|uniref:Uncharacterized protein n=1 Tax=Mycena chlorophos TaxID=658473 RepID=A0A8H6RXD1_MYCCL|nr:hypothetical protein HMN09_01402700 [Mycena chlorophos]